MLDAAAIANALCERGWYCAAGALDDALVSALRQEAQQLQQGGALQRAGVGRGAAHRLHEDTRRDCIHWLSGATPAQAQYLGLLETLRSELNRELMLGLFEFEAHFAHYSPGAFYRKHLDSFAGSASRIVSVVSYLNADWPQDAGGELLAYVQGNDEDALRVLPEAGSVIIFLSEKIPHEVLPATRDRYSVAGWFRLNQTDASTR